MRVLATFTTGRSPAGYCLPPALDHLAYSAFLDVPVLATVLVKVLVRVLVRLRVRVLVSPL